MERRLTKDKWAYVVLGVILLAVFFWVREPFGDDFYYQSQGVHDLGTLTDFLFKRYTEWSSRLFTETVIVLFMNLGMTAWRIFVVVNILIAALSIKYLIGLGSSLWQNAVLCMLTASFPVSYYVSAGWVTTTSVYLFSAVLGFIALFPIRRQLEGKETAWWEAAIYFLSAAAACNHEQVCAILLGVYLCTCLYYALFKHKIHWIQVCMILICVVSMLFIFSCPGNGVRKIAETNTWLPEFAEWTVMEKMLRGFLHAADYFFYTRNVVFISLVLVSVIAAMVIQKVEDAWKKKIAFAGAIWLYVSIGLIFLQKVPFVGSKNIVQWGRYGENMLSSWSDILRAVSAAALLVLLVMELYWLLGGGMEFLTAFIIFSAGFGSVVLVGFSPTIYASGNRVFTFFFYAVFLLISFLLKKMYPEEMGRKEREILFLVAFFTLAALVKNVFIIYRL